MFQKPAFGSSISGFGMQSTFGSSAATTSSPFGGFKPAGTTSAFGAPPAFGAAAAPQPAATGGLFGNTNTSGGLFSSSSTPAPAFGASTSGFGFGANTSGGGLFTNNTTTPLFGNNQNNSAFGAKPAGFGFGGTSTASSSGGLFGNTSGGGLFGQGSTLPATGTLFNNTSGGFGQQQQASGTGHVKYNPVVGTDVVVKSGTSQNINIKHHCITCMKEYEGKSLEELRLEDYTAGRKGAQGSVFGFAQPQEAKPLFGTSGTFGQPATTSAPNVFGGGALSTGGFGQTNTFSFGGNTQTNTNTTGLFGANKPAFGATSTAGTGLFGSTATTQQASTFGTNTNTFGFGSNIQNQSSTGGLFGAKPATSAFGTAAPTTGFGGFGGGGLFGQKTQAQPPAFGNTTGIGTMAGGFGTSTSTASNVFGVGNAFGKPNTTQPSFGFNNTQPTLGLNTGLGGNTFQNKPGTTFPTLGGGGMFAQQNNNNTFRTGLEGGMGGGGIFGNNSALGGTGLGLGLNANNNSMMNSTLSGCSAAGNVHEQILTLAARPYGDSPLFKDLLPDSNTTAEDVLKPTNPAAVSAVLERAACRVTSPAPPLRVQPTHRTHTHKKSLFDGLEESDASLEEKLTLRPSRKRLVLRQNHRNDSQEQDSIGYNRSQEEQPSVEIQTNGVSQGDKENSKRDEVDKAKRNIDFPDSQKLDISSDRQASWLSSPKPSWSDKEKPADNDPSPRLYPNLDKELPSDGSERYSWLTTKPLRKPRPRAPDCVESSVRELGVVSHNQTNANTTNNSRDNLDVLSVSEEEHVAPRDSPPHPTGVKLTRPGYYTIPSLDEMIKYMRPDGSCVVPHLTIGRTNYGNVYYDCEIDVAGLDLDSLVHFLNKEVIVYPEESEKPAVGEGLNRRAIVTLDRIWPRDKTEKRHITDPDRLLKMDYEGKLRRVCDKHDTKFIEYRPQTGSWVFRVEHFSKYGLTDSDEEDDVTPDVIKRQLVTQTLQKAAAPPPKQPVLSPSAGLGGVGLGGVGLGGVGLGGVGLGGVGLGGMNNGLMAEDSLYALQNSSLNVLSAAGKAFEMDTTEDNTESTSLYQDSHKAYGVKSPTAELARLENRQSHNVQLMKASLYADAEMDEDISVSSGDQLVPMVRPLTPRAYTDARAHTVQHDEMEPEVVHVAEPEMRPLIIKPHTMVLKYHRKVPPFKKTIAGRVSASCLSDMSVSRARHSRVGFGPSLSLVYNTTYNRIADLPQNAWLSDVGEYVSGRGDDDWSEPLLARLAIGQPDSSCNVIEVLSRQLDALLSHSSLGDQHCPRLQLHTAHTHRRDLLKQLKDESAKMTHYIPQFGVSGAYCYEVWQLCEALWAADLENDGVPGTDAMSIVLRHRRLLEWLTGAVKTVTDEELATPVTAEVEDESDKHSARVWTLLLGGRVLEACKLARDNGDYNMATLIAQSAGDPSFRSLIARQVSLWRECGADKLMSANKLAVLELIAGITTRNQLYNHHWLQALHATARFLCPQVPSLEQIIRKFESFFTSPESDDEVDLSMLDSDFGVQCPLPPYLDNFSECRPRPLDLRYTLLRSRALNCRPKLSPAHYTNDPLDYSLSFLLSVWLGTLDAGTAVGAAAQLEAGGAWHRAVQVLAYIQDDHVRSHLIRDMLDRHCPSRADTQLARDQLQLLEQLRVPNKWILMAMANRAKYERLPSLVAQHLVSAGEWNAAHKVLMDELLPDAVLSDNLESIKPIVLKLNEAADRNEVSGWDKGGLAIYHYIRVCDEIRGACGGGGGGGVASRLEQLRPAVTAACHALANMDATTMVSRACVCEAGAALTAALAGGGAPPELLATLTRALALPPDCTHAPTHKLTCDIAERASELCIENTSTRERTMS